MSNKLVLSSDAPTIDGLPQRNADNVATHTITIQEQDEDGNLSESGNTLKIYVGGGAVVLSNNSPTLVNGQTTITVGPTNLSQMLTITVLDQTGLFGTIIIRFF